MPLFRSTAYISGGGVRATGDIESTGGAMRAGDGFTAQGLMMLGIGNSEDQLRMNNFPDQYSRARVRVHEMPEHEHFAPAWNETYDIILFNQSSYTDASLTLPSDDTFVHVMLMAVNKSSTDIPLSVPNLSYSGVLSAGYTYVFLGNAAGGWDIIAKYGNDF